jgi:hypothetical protein
MIEGQNNIMEKHILFIIVLSAILFLFLFYKVIPLMITGFSTFNNIYVSIEEKIDGRITVDLQPYLEIGKTQNIYAEFSNTGTTQVTAIIEEKIYFYDNGRLNLSAYYYDASVLVKPGMKRGFDTVFIPPQIGTYYVDTKASYSTKKVEVWNAFLVFYYLQPFPQPTLPSYGITLPSAAAEESKLSLDYPKEVKLSHGESKLISITVKNTGKTPVHNLKLYVSTSNLLGININPKQVYGLELNKSTIFLISVEVPSDITDGKYPLGFEVMSDEINEQGAISLEISALSISIKDDVYQTILNYEYLITEIENDILSTSLKGFDVSLAQKSLDNAKINIQLAMDYYTSEDYDKARDKLVEVKRYLEDAVFQLANATLVVKAPAFFLVWIIIVVIIIAVLLVFFVYWWRKKKKKERPRLLRATTESET